MPAQRAEKSTVDKSELMALIRAYAQREPASNNALSALTGSVESLSNSLSVAHSDYAKVIALKDARIAELERQRDDQKLKADRLEFSRIELERERDKDAAKNRTYEQFGGLVRDIAVALIGACAKDDRLKEQAAALINAVPKETLTALRAAAPKEYEALLNAL